MNSEPEFSFNERYGIKPERAWLAPAIFFGIVGTAWIIWAGLHHANPEIRSELISFSVTSEKEISIRYSMTRADPARPILCTLVARDFDKNVVGQIDDPIEPGKSSVTRITAIPTRSAAVTATVARCRLA